MHGRSHWNKVRGQRPHLPLTPLLPPQAPPPPLLCALPGALLPKMKTPYFNTYVYVFVKVMDTTLSSAATTTMVMNGSGGLDVGMASGGADGGGTGAAHVHADQHQHDSSFIAGPGRTACTNSSPSQPQRWTVEQSRLLRKLVQNPENGGKDWTNIAKKVRANESCHEEEEDKKEAHG